MIPHLGEAITEDNEASGHAEEGADGLSFKAYLAHLNQKFGPEAPVAQPQETGSAPPLGARLPLFPEAVRPLVNDLARSALFACVQGKDRQWLDNALLATVANVEIRFTGEQLNQDDHDLLMQIVHTAATVPLGDPIAFTSYALLTALKRDHGGAQYRQVQWGIARLVAGTVRLRHTVHRVVYMGHLIDAATHDEHTNQWVVLLNPDLVQLYGPKSYTLIDWEQRLLLRGKDLARWLHLFLATHATPFPMHVATLKQLCGSRAATLKKFRQMLRQALADLQACGAIHAWQISTSDCVHIDRGHTLTRSQQRHVDREHNARVF